MTINLFLPQVTRIPISGPAPYNTLVCVQALSAGGPQTIEYEKMNRYSVGVGTAFRLMGFDQRVPPPFAHSTTACLGSIGPAKDSSWLYAVDEVTGAGFSPLDGSYYVTLNVAAMPPDPLPESCVQLAENFGWCFNWMIIQVTSFVLCYEPPLPERPSQHTHSLATPKSEHAGLIGGLQRPGEDLTDWISRKFEIPFVRRPPGLSKRKCRCG